MGKDKKKKTKLSKEDKKNITRCSVLLMASLLNITVASVAWFTSNKENNIRENRFDSKGVPFELVTVGKAGLYDKMLGNLVEKGIEITDLYENGIEDDNGDKIIDGTITSGRQSIRWLMTKENNFNNLSSDNNNDFLHPGSYGSLDFYIIPLRDGDLNIKLSLDIEIYDYRQPNGSKDVLNAVYCFDDLQKVKQFLFGHILFFKTRTDGKNGSYRYSDLIEYDSQMNLNFEKELLNAEKDRAYKTTIYWVWPDLMGQLVLPEDNPILDDVHPGIFSSDEEKNRFIEKIISKPENYFHGFSESDKKFEKAHEVNESDQSDAKKSELFNSETFSDTLNRIVQCDFLYSDPNNDYSRLSYYWNNADQYIGVSSSYITAELAAFENKSD